MLPSTPSGTPFSEPGASRRRVAAAEALCVFLLIMFDIWWLRYRVAWAWMPILALVVASQAARGETPKKLGFRWSNLAESLRVVVPVLLFAAVALALLGLACGTLRDVPSGSAGLSFGYYCFWGLFQQYLLNGYFTNRLAELPRRPSAHRVALGAASLFAVAHVPNWFLILVTFAGGYASARFYLKHRNLFALGLAHGTLGSLVYLVTPDSITHHLYVGPKWFLH